MFFAPLVVFLLELSKLVKKFTLWASYGKKPGKKSDLFVKNIQRTVLMMGRYVGLWKISLLETLLDWLESINTC